MRYQELFDLGGKVALCVGVGGIGHAIALGLVEYGCTVVPADLDRCAAQKSADAIRATSGSETLGLNIDVTDPESVKVTIDQVVQTYGSLDVVVNTVGLNIFKNALDLSPEEFGRLLTINLVGAWHLSCAAARAMIAGRGGKIIHLSSVTSFRGSPGQSAYAAAKAGLNNLVQSLALEWIEHGVYVNAIAPIMTETPINTHWLNELPGRKDIIARRIPVGRLGRPQDFVGAVLYLASSASDFVVGQTLAVDGGSSAKHPLIAN